MTDENKIRIVVNKLIAQGITDENEQLEIIMRDYRHLLRQPTEAEMEAAKEELLHTAVEKAIANLNRATIAEKGHPFAVCMRIGGVKHFKRYDALTVEEIADFRWQGLIV